MTTRRGGALAAAALLALLGAGCGDGSGPAVGDPGDVVVAAHPALWGRIQRRVVSTLEPSQIATRGRAFEVSHVDPANDSFPERRRARQLLLIGTAADPWIAEALESLDEPPPPAPALVEVQDVWAEGQWVTALLVPDGDARAAVYDQLAEVRTRYDQRYREWVLERAFAGGANESLADTLLAEAGFSVLLPKEYEWSRAGDAYLFRKAGADSSEVIRHLTVTWRSPIPTGMQGQGMLAWRQQLAAEHYGIRQRVALAGVKATQTTHRGNVAYQLLGIWENTRRGGPPRGPFILRAVICQAQDKMYLVDGWVWAADQDQHEYLVEVESIANSFRCGSARSTQPNE